MCGARSRNVISPLAVVDTSCVVLKLTVLAAIFAGLLSYASAAADGPRLPAVSFEAMAKQLHRAGYVHVGDFATGTGAISHVFELGTSASPHAGGIARLEFICRGDSIVEFAHYESCADAARERPSP